MALSPKFPLSAILALTGINEVSILKMSIFFKLYFKTTDGDYVEDLLNTVEIWNQLQLDVYKGGYSTAPVWTNVAGTSSIGIGEHIKLTLSNQNSGTVLTDYK